jgi:glycosyltransferase involved in cell wall biosynthesis
MALLARGLSRQGVEPLILSAALDRTWAPQAEVDGVLVERLPFPVTPGWGVLRYMHALGRRLRTLAPSLAGVIVSGLRQDAFAALGALQGSGVPVILRADSYGPGGECDPKHTAPFAGRVLARCTTAGGVIASSRAGAAELVAKGFATAKVHHIPSAAAVLEPRTTADRSRARTVLANATVDLWCNDQTTLFLCISRMERDAGLFELVRSWADYQYRNPSACLWLIGDGPEREPLFERLGDLGLRYRVAMPGSFDDWSDLLAAADFLVAPKPWLHHGQMVAEAVALGVPVVAPQRDSWEAATHEKERAELLARLLQSAPDPTFPSPEAPTDQPQFLSADAAAQRHLELLEAIRIGAD